jgi:hypothetical protein
MVAWGSAIWPIALAAAAAVVLYVAVEDVITAFKGGKSVTEEFLNSLGYLIGIGDLGTGVFEGWRIIARLFNDEMARGTTIGGAFVDILLQIAGVGESSVRIVNALAEALLSAATQAVSAASGIGGLLSMVGLGGSVADLGGLINRRGDAALERGRQREEDRAGSARRTREENTAKRASMAAVGITPEALQYRDMLRRASAGGTDYRSTGRIPASVVGGGAAQVNQTIEAPMDVTVNISEAGIAPEEIDRRVRSGVRSAFDEQNRRLQAATPRVAGAGA